MGGRYSPAAAAIAAGCGPHEAAGRYCWPAPSPGVCRPGTLYYAPSSSVCAICLSGVDINSCSLQSIHVKLGIIWQFVYELQARQFTSRTVSPKNFVPS